MKWWIMLKCWLLHQFNHIISETSIRRVISGKYEREYTNNGALVKDTLAIIPYSILTDTYLVERKTVHTYPEDYWNQQIKKDKWVAVYHTPTRQLVRGVSGRVFSFIPEQAMLLFEDKEYRKLPDLSDIDSSKL